MKSLAYVLTFLAINLVCLPTQAQEYTRYRLPLGRRCTVGTTTYQCFDLPEYRELLLMDSDLHLAVENHVTDVSRIASLTLATDELRLALNDAEAARTLLEAERVRLAAMWEEENRLRHEAENRPTFDWIPWTIAGGLAISTLILAIIVGVSP